MSLLLGAIADDLTGATDLANTLVRNGMRTVQMIGVPSDKTKISDADAVVIALKTRSAPVNEAISSSLDALRWLRAAGTQQYFFKYCSTFDSTPRGNIGPVADAIMEALNCAICTICPAFPDARRTVYNGYLFVGEHLLSDSSMKDHPLTPMTDSNLIRLIEAQSTRRAGLVPLSIVTQGVEAIKAAIKELCLNGCGYAIVDALSDSHLRIIGAAMNNSLLVTGGSGVAMGLPDNFKKRNQLQHSVAPHRIKVSGRSLVVAGSCSEATRAQVAHCTDIWPSIKVNVTRIVEGQPVVKELLAWAQLQSSNSPLLVYSSSSPQEVAKLKEITQGKKIGGRIEDVLAQFTIGLVATGVRKIVIAGGETSGAIVKALGIKKLNIGTEIDPGVPWTQTQSDPSLALALKSGNLGGVNFFEKAFGMLK